MIVDVGAAELAGMAALDLAAELQRQRLLAVADGEDRNARLEHLLRRARAALVDHRGRAAREDHALGPHRGEGLGGAVERVDFAVDAGFAEAARDQLGDLRAEVDDEDGVLRGRAGGCHGEDLAASPGFRKGLRRVARRMRSVFGDR